MKTISLRFILITGIFLLSLFIFGWIAHEIVAENENHLDTLVFDKLHHITTPALTKLMTIITFFGSHYFLLPAYAVLTICFIKKHRKLALTIAIIGLTSTALLYFLKDVYKRIRPLDPLVAKLNGFSFPSGHSFSAFTFFGLLIYIIWKLKVNPALRWTASMIFFLFACAIAFSRVYLHLHYASDVIAGFCLCLIWLGLSFWATNKLDKKNGAHK
ncbi:MAG TPA: phosphatase PAP2 family protein [Chitinophagaceae bacterium]|nr:phosphatase PAP2 family protein [Chitinophagaceae bacterium]